MIRNLWSIWIIFFGVFFCNIIKINNFLYRFIILLHSVSSYSITRTLPVPYTYVSIKSIACILLSLFELKAILLISSVKTLCLSLLNLCCICNISSLFFVNSVRLSMSILFFSYRAELLLNNFYNFQT